MDKHSGSQSNELNSESPEFIAGQLRKPSGEFAVEIAEEMNRANRPLVELTMETLQPGDWESLLEVGFGSGRFFSDLLGQANGLTIKGVDYSPEMVEQAKRVNQSLISEGRLELILASSGQLPFANDVFDKVYCNNVIYFWDDPAEHLEEIKRVLVPGGRFYAGFRPKEDLKQLPMVEYGFTLYEEQEWEEVLEKNGFRVREVCIREDPELEIDGNNIRLTSICMVAEI